MSQSITVGRGILSRPVVALWIMVLWVVAAPTLPAAQADVVYQNNDLATQTLIRGFGSPGIEGGDQITLAGSCRVITQLELAHIAFPGTINMIVRLYANDGPVSPNAAAGNEPGTLLWDSGSLPITGTASAQSGGLQIFTVAVPNVTVPDTFTWTLQRVDGATISLFYVGPPSIGSSSDFVWTHFPTVWSPNTVTILPSNGFYAVVTAAGGAAGITCPADAVVDCGGDTSPTATGAATATGCGTVTVSSSDALAATCGAAGTITRTWTANDGSATPATCTQTIVVVDNTPPVLAGVPGGFPIECDAVPPAANPTATDSCDANPVVTFSETSVAGACAQSFALHRTWTATDACGNSTSATQIITVQDTKAPTFTGVPVDATAECDAVPARVDPTVADNCDGGAVTTFAETTAGTCGATVITRTWTATDACGNSSAVSQTVNVTDTTPPVATAALAFASAGDEEGKPNDDDEGMFQVVASCSDNCAGVAGCTAPVVTAQLQCWGGGVIAVAPGDIVEIEMDDEGCEIEVEGSKIEIEGDVTLVVTCTDASGNTTQATAAPLGLQPDNDDEFEDDD
ncbi:MAG: hypothetical protein ACE5E5_05370 [Phycisphaerae bacterium]